MTEVDVAVIGGGVTGLASALALARHGASVCILEREGKTGRVTSTHNSGVIHAGIYYPQGSLKARLCVEGRDRLYRFCDQHQVPHARCGKLVIAADEHELAELDRLLTIGHANGVSSLIRVDGAFVRTTEPTVRAVGALWSPDTGIVEAEALVKTLERLCRENGVALVVGSPLIDAKPQTRSPSGPCPNENSTLLRYRHCSTAGMIGSISNSSRRPMRRSASSTCSASTASCFSYGSTCHGAPG